MCVFQICRVFWVDFWHSINLLKLFVHLPLLLLCFKLKDHFLNTKTNLMTNSDGQEEK
jgi:hypothetical protein